MENTDPPASSTNPFGTMVDTLSGRNADHAWRPRAEASPRRPGATSDDAGSAASQLADRLADQHSFPVPFSPALPGQSGAPPAAALGFTQPVAVQAFVALRLHGEAATVQRWHLWKQTAFRWAGQIRTLASDEEAAALALRAVATVAADRAPPTDSRARVGLAETWPPTPDWLEQRFGVPCTDSPVVKPQDVDVAVRTLVAELEDPTAQERLVPLTPAGRQPADHAAAWLLLLCEVVVRPEAQRGDRSPGHWRASMWRQVATCLPAGPWMQGGVPSWRLLLDAGRLLCRRSTSIESAYGVEIEGWQDVLVQALQHGDEPKRQRKLPAAATEWPELVPSAGTSLGDARMQARYLGATLQAARRNAAFEAELHARHFLRVVSGELFYAPSRGFQPRTQEALTRPLLLLLVKLEQDPRHGATARALRPALAALDWFGGPVRVSEPLTEALERLHHDAAVAIRAQAAAVPPTAQAIQPMSWLDAFSPGVVTTRAARLGAPGATDRAMVERFHRTHDAALLVADAMRDVLLLSHWERHVGSGPGPGFTTWANHVDRIAESGLPLERVRDRSIVAAIITRMSEPPYVARLRDIVRELQQRVPSADTLERS